MLLTVTQVNGQHAINLAGTWEVTLDKNSELELKYPDQSKLDGIINLPASLAEQGFGYKTIGSDYGILTPTFKYIGKAIYSRLMNIPEDWREKELRVLVKKLQIIMDDLHTAAQENNWTVDWAKVEEFCKKAEKASEGSDSIKAIRYYARGISSLMRQLRSQQNAS